MKINIFCIVFWIFSMFIVSYAAYNYRNLDICQYYNKHQAIDIKTDPVVSQNPLNQSWQSLEELECAGKVKIYRDSKLELQDFTVVVPTNKYSVSIEKVGGGMLLNVKFSKQPFETAKVTKKIDKMDISI